MGETWRVLERIVWWGMVYSKISNRKIYKNTPTLHLNFQGVTDTLPKILNAHIVQFLQLVGLNTGMPPHPRTKNQKVNTE